jgi:hypothetical protein
MIERVNHTRRISTTAEPAPKWTYNFAGACLLEASFRVQLVDQLVPVYITDAITAMKLTFATGNPPDFGLGNLQTEIMSIPNVLPPLPAWEAKREEAEAALSAIAAQLAGLKTQVAQAELIVKEAEVERATARSIAEASSALYAARNAVLAAEAEKRKAETAIENVQNEKPSPWIGPINASFSRTFNAVRFEPQVIPLDRFEEEYVIELEENITVYRPQDLGTTPVTIGGG